MSADGQTDTTLGEITVCNTQYDTELRQVMERVLRRDSNCVDVGTYKGGILREIVQVAPEGRHYAFEPLEMHHPRLRELFPGVIVSHAALSDVEGKSSFQHVVTEPAYSGFLRRHYDHPNETVVEIEVETRRLDDAVPAEMVFDLIKIDVEGAELQVLRGGLETIRRSTPFVAFEHGLGAADCYGTTPEQVFELLADACGLRISLLEDWLAGRPSLSMRDFCGEFYGHRSWFFLAHPEAGY